MSFLFLLGLLMACWPKTQGLALAVWSTKSHNEKTVDSINKWLLTDLIPAALLAVRKPGD